MYFLMTFSRKRYSKGLYPQSDESIAIVDIDASKGFVYLWVHLSFAIFAIFDLKRQLKLLEMVCDQIQTCLIFPLRLACFPIKIGRNAQWVSMKFRPFTLFSSLKVHFRWKNYPSVGTLYAFDRGMWCHSTRIELFDFDDNFGWYSLWVRPFSLLGK